jgi:hypothetical protein
VITETLAGKFTLAAASPWQDDCRVFAYHSSGNHYATSLNAEFLHARVLVITVVYQAGKMNAKFWHARARVGQSS